MGFSVLKLIISKTILGMDLRRLVIYMFVMLISFQAYAQHEELFDRTWYLDKLVMDGDTIYNPTRGDLEYDLASTIYFNSENEGDIDFGGCPGEYHFIDMEFDKTDNFFATSGIGGFPFQFCSDFEHLFEGLRAFTDLYFYDFFYGYGIDGEISIYYTIFNENNSIQILVLTNPDDFEAHYSSAHLSTSDFNELIFTIYPNPAQDWLYIHLEELSNNTYLEVYDIHGKLLENFMLSKLETQLDVSEYVSGLYFIKMTDNLGNAQIGKFIKQ